MKKIAVIIATLAAFLTFVPSPAYAHATRIRQGEDVARINRTHNVLAIADKECDGNNALAQFQYLNANGEISFGTRYDTNGCRVGASRSIIVTVIVWVRVCEERLNRAVIYKCTDFVRV